MTSEFYEGVTISTLKRNGKWVVFIDGKEDASFRTKTEAKHYIQRCIKG